MYYTDCDLDLPKPDRVRDKLYISGYNVAECKDTLATHKISHILSLCGEACFPKDFKYLVVPSVCDSPYQDVLAFFPHCVQFIEKGIKEGTGVLVHCAAGISRSSTVVIAFLMYSEKISLGQAMQEVKRCRPCVCPNVGFRSQLQLWGEMGYTLEGKSKPHTHYKIRKIAEQFRKTGRVQSIEFAEDPHHSEAQQLAYSCLQCQRSLFTEEHVMVHEKGMGFCDLRCSLTDQLECDSFFIQPVSWMKDLQKSAGELQCPDCSTLLGRWAWQETQCTCLTRVYPYFRIEKAKVQQQQQKRESAL